MRIIKKIFGLEIREPKPAPCGHVPPLFRTRSGRYVTITLYPHDTEFVKIAPAIWCRACHWVKITHEDFDYYRSFDGNQKA